MSCRQPILLPPMSNLLLSPNLQPHPLVLQGHLSLAAWMVTGKTCLQMEFQSKLPNFSAPTLGEQALAGAYNSAWKQGSSWCSQRKIDPFCSSVASVADYLTELLKQGKSYRTINSHRSAISAFHPPIGGVRVGQHELICKVVGACFNANPPQPRYVVTWDVDKVLDYIHVLHPFKQVFDS